MTSAMISTKNGIILEKFQYCSSYRINEIKRNLKRYCKMYYGNIKDYHLSIKYNNFYYLSIDGYSTFTKHDA